MRPKWHMVIILVAVLIASIIAISLESKGTAPDEQDVSTIVHGETRPDEDVSATASNQAVAPSGKPKPTCNPTCNPGFTCKRGTCVADKKNCDDNDPCTTDTITKGKCQYTPKCSDDGNPCTDTCVDGECNVPKDLGTTTCGVGECKVTVGICVNGQPQTCTPGAPSTEVCNGLDDDCDGTVDEGNPGGAESCDTGLPGVCSDGTTACISGGIICNQNHQPSAEICDGFDNDCNGQIDDGLLMTGLDGNVLNSAGQACGSGLCAGGTTRCSQDQTGIVCNTETLASPEICDGIDNDCDGTVDEGCCNNVPMQSGEACCQPGDAGPGGAYNPITQDCCHGEIYNLDTGRTCTSISTCHDGVANGDETDVDCGGLTCDACSDGDACTTGDDCMSGVCTDNICQAPTCSDTIKNDGETDVDCGGWPSSSCCANWPHSPCGCADGKDCAWNPDCSSGFCSPSTHVCTQPTCNDGYKNGPETDVDCGDGCPNKCADDRDCERNTDCTSDYCVFSTEDEGTPNCDPISCFDGILNNEETGIDCGGSCGRCSGETCYLNRQCASGICGPINGVAGCIDCDDGRNWCFAGQICVNPGEGRPHYCVFP